MKCQDQGMNQNLNAALSKKRIRSLERQDNSKTLTLGEVWTGQPKCCIKLRCVINCIVFLVDSKQYPTFKIYVEIV